MAKIRLNLHYPASDEYTYQTVMERINLDEEKDYDISHGRGFIISSPKPIKEDVKDPDGIFSTRYGRTLDDLGAWTDRYRCRCGNMELRGKFNAGRVCPICKTKVKFVDDDFSYFGWIVLKEPYHFIHPTLYMALASFIGTEELERILEYAPKKDEDGKDVEIKRPKKEPFFGIGMMAFYERFDEIMEYYRATKCKTQAKTERYFDIMKDRDKVFARSFPVFTTLLRPFMVEGGELHFEDTNAIFKLMATLAAKISSDKLQMGKNVKSKNDLLYNFQTQITKLFNEINKILSGKKGSARQLLGGRFAFSARSVIIPSSTLQVDEITLSYQALVGLLEQRIIGILRRAYGMHYNDAYVFLDSNRRNENEIIKQIIISIIKSYPRGIPVLINRNPTICYGSILQMYVVGIGKGYTMALPLQILRGLAADFDGDTLNCLYLYNKKFIEAAEKIFNPRNAFMISRNDGLFNNDYGHQRDTLINANTIVNLSRSHYTEEEIDLIERAKQFPKIVLPPVPNTGNYKDDEFDNMPEGYNTAVRDAVMEKIRLHVSQ